MPFLTRYPAPALVAAALALGLGASAAQAGECPPEHKLAQPRELTAPPDVGTMRQVLTSVDMSGWREVDGLALRMRRLTVAKDGFVPLHYHNDRPSIVYVVAGEIVEHATFCGVPILHKAGEWTPESGDFMGHWWENKSGAEVVLISTDVVPLENVNF